MCGLESHYAKAKLKSIT